MGGGDIIRELGGRVEGGLGGGRGGGHFGWFGVEGGGEVVGEGMRGCRGGARE